MIELDLNKCFYSARTRSGVNNKGDWQLIAVKEDSGHKELVIWVHNRPVDIPDGGMFRIKKILAVKYAARKDNRGQWKDDVSVQADIEPAGLTSGDDGFKDIEGVDDNPFASGGDDPFANTGNMFDGDDPFAASDEQLPF